MQKKTINGLLIAFCITIYAAIFYKAFGKKEAINEPLGDIGNYTNANLDISNDKDSISLFFPKRSPFGTPSRRNIQSVKNSKKVKPNTSNKPKSKKENLVWPNITYYGFLESKKSNNKLVVVKVEDKIFKKREGDDLNDDLKIIKAYGDSLIISFGKVLKTVIKFKK